MIYPIVHSTAMLHKLVQDIELFCSRASIRIAALAMIAVTIIAVALVVVILDCIQQARYLSIMSYN